MRAKQVMAVALLSLLALPWAQAHAGVRIAIGIPLFWPRPVYVQPAYVVPAPVVVAPAPVYVVPGQPPIYVQPGTAVYQAPPPPPTAPMPAPLPR